MPNKEQEHLSEHETETLTRQNLKPEWTQNAHYLLQTLHDKFGYRSPEQLNTEKCCKPGCKNSKNCLGCKLFESDGTQWVQLDSDQRLPPTPLPVDMDATHKPPKFRDGYKWSQEDMLKANFRRIKPETLPEEG